jgi:hypothetical protein
MSKGTIDWHQATMSYLNAVAVIMQYEPSEELFDIPQLIFPVDTGAQMVVVCADRARSP